MEAIELLDIIAKGESSTVQFKERVIKGKPGDAYDLAIEMVAFSNSQGGLLIIGVNDKTGALNGLSFDEINKWSQSFIHQVLVSHGEHIISLLSSIPVAILYSSSLSFSQG